MAFGPNANEDIIVSAGAASATFDVSYPHAERVFEMESAENQRRLEFVIPHPSSPAQLDMGSDDRVLGIGFFELAITPSSE